ncbi:Testis-specific serine/threonine-protein kinase 4 [Saguinus oedipus]|uniref:non-specific serine/threonine protein kinase n=1 Tax=Saguinus oedipus TaxID=9490 RepID=A0ABQ9UDS5_SAGOE|nr:Testis-specific serine/threonine-protein kinase 4 [Saguinus oedipus]
MAGVQLYKTYQSSQCSCLLLELAAWGDLLEHINATLDYHCHPGLEKETHGLFWQLVSAMTHCHSMGIVHRDLKCKNILLDDCGLLKLTSESTAPKLTPSLGMNASTCRGPPPTLVPARPLTSALPEGL